MKCILWYWYVLRACSVYCMCVATIIACDDELTGTLSVK